MGENKVKYIRKKINKKNEANSVRCTLADVNVSRFVSFAALVW